MEYKERSAAVQAQEYLQDLISFKPDIKVLPSQREIADKLRISRNAVLHSLDKLKSEDLISSKERTGIVKNTKVDINMLGMKSMSSELNDDSVAIVHLLTTIIALPINLQNFFGLETNKLIKIERMRMRKSKPITYEIVYFDQAKFADLIKVDFTNISLYKLLQKKYGIKPTYGKENITCCLADKKISKILKIQKNMPLYKVDSFNYLDNDEPLETTTQYLIGSYFKYHFNANNIYDYRED
ncbi:MULTISPECIES: GntR family transcriptional regulator [unclassified Lactobacillus]|uniref:GntR family transcriptional regulator n=1 Tax=unclassified Lactobacillus TaxID=2620435 RepID=UPI000EFD2872|nr:MULTISPECIES: GntR family transcriptional regulator [unclassified Lactobacillus]RMC23647.1 GntR family transcriptional regulator [Lactobacillus sp. ESL0247]RMC27408.1 GntR family transcriptional regulator [Lactobacillus sp. ESL0246]RMC30609.1 GntR family transcriptional regulator [Lactobacillus sp. ESL0245]RMC47648.1 GntR family transcriptional regulator [Lactobacillus sp. ESL0228]